MNKPRLLSVFNLILLLILITVSYGTQTGLVGGKTMGQVSDQYPSLFTPAPLTFSIWGLIYTLLLVFCIRHLVIAYRESVSHDGNQELLRIGPWFGLNNLLTTAWLFTWGREEIAVSMILIFGQLLTLIIIHLRARIYDRFAGPGSKWLTQLPLSIYFGWINVAVIANVSVYLVATGWKGAGMDYSPVTWAMVMIVVAGIITMLVVFMRRNVAFGLVLLWALYGIILRQSAPEHAGIRSTAWLVMAVIAACCFIQLVANGLFSKKSKGISAV